MLIVHRVFIRCPFRAIATTVHTSFLKSRYRRR
nr:MAG TPA: hypothetical protein [Caudoviricetes sp.]